MRHTWLLKLAQLTRYQPQADDVSKDEMDTVRAQLLARFPLTPLTVAPTARPNNVLNSPQAAAAWTCKADEKFDQ